jgi:hypothetical protein
MRRRKKLNLRSVNTIESKKDDIIRVIDFRVIPKLPKTGKKIIISMTIMNVSSKKLKQIPYQIGIDEDILHSGVRYSVPPGDSFNVCISWTATKGDHFFFGDADPHNTLKEPKIKQYNNLPQGIDVIIK